MAAIHGRQADGPDAGARMNAEHYCRQIMQQAGSTFALAFRGMTRDQQRAMRAVYAFARIIDDVVDAESPVREKAAALSEWRARLATIGGTHVAPPTGKARWVPPSRARCALWDFLVHPLRGYPDSVVATLDNGRPVESGHPVMAELAWGARTFGCHPRYARALLEGCARDITTATYRDWPALRDYCYSVAGTVGLLCLPIFGVREEDRTRQAAINLGHAFQLTNILRDLREDAARGRCYLPQDDLAHFGIAAAQFSAGGSPGIDRERFRSLMFYEIARAQSCYRSAWERFTVDEQRLMRAARVMSRAYHRVLQKIAADPVGVLHGRVGLTWWEKVRVLCAS
ncbi:MAG: phytoene/squalene synthase family protein [Deltaproteobacteria bacterium]|nr:phytoene/squalene synthase family protein [Deltaproteobacteria bacterium]